MPPTYKEASFPVGYREAEVRSIMKALYRRRSIAIMGLAGMGKSNLLRFIISHPQARARYLRERANDYAFVHVDCAALAESDEGEILDELAFQLRRDIVRSRDGISAGAVQTPNTSLNLRRALREHILTIPSELNLVIALDYFDEAAARLDSAFFNYLFHLRNSRPKGNLSYVFATRRPMGHLGELQELLDDGCTVGPLTHGDALDSIRRDEARLGCTFTPAQRERLIACTGGHPGFLKNASELLCSGRVDTDLPEEALVRQLLESKKVENLCQELWDDLTPSEQHILINVSRGIAPSPSATSAIRVDVADLERNGVLVRGKQAGVKLFCLLFESFAHSLEFAIAEAVRITAVFPNQARIETSTSVETVTLSPKLFALLFTLAEAEGEVLTTDELISRVYGNEALGVSDAALSQLVKRLRRALDPLARRMTNDPAHTCVETIRGTGYRLNG